MPIVVNGIEIHVKTTEEGSAAAAAEIRKVSEAANSVGTANDAAGKQIAGANTEMQGMALSAKDLNVAIGIVTAGLGAMAAAFAAGEIAAGNERLITSGEQLAAQYGGSLDQILAKVTETSLGTVSQMDIIASSNKAMMLGVSADADQLANLMEIAALRGRAMGLSTTQAFDDMVRGIGRMSPMILDNLGIVVDAEGTYARYATSIGKTSGELTRAEKIQALLNKVLEEGNKMLEESGGLAEDNAAKYERWNAELENTKNYLLENALGMSRFADMGADTLTVFRDLADNGFGYGADQLNAFSLVFGLAEERVAGVIERGREADAARLEGLASLYATTAAAQELAGATQNVAAADAEAVKGAMQVQETYDKYNEKLADLQADHDELLIKKQDLINQGWLPESEKIQAVNEKLAENEQKQRDVTLAMQGTLAQMLINTAAAGLDAEAQLALARATGQIDEASYAALSAQLKLKAEYEAGKLTADEYTQKTMALRAAVQSLESKKIKITVDAILNEMRTAVQTFTSDAAARRTVNRTRERYAEGTEGWMTVPPGYPNDSYPIALQSGERFAVIPAGAAASPMPAGSFGGGMTVVFAPQIGTLFGDENESMNKLYGAFVRMIDQAKADGHLPAH